MVMTESDAHRLARQFHTRVYQHRDTGALAMVTMREVGIGGRETLRLEFLNGVLGPITDASPFRLSVTRELIRCCPMQGTHQAFFSGDCTIHGPAEYLTNEQVEALVMSRAQFQDEWEPIAG